MPIKIKLSKKQLAIHEHEEGYLARAISRGRYTFDMMADDIAHNCTLTRSDVVGCMEALITETKQHLLSGYTIEFKGLGNFQLLADSRMTSAETVESPGFRIRDMLKGFKMRFQPAPQFKRLLATDTMDIERVE